MANSYYFDSFDGKKIFVREWIPQNAPIGVIQIIHGMVEHSGRYEKFANYLSSQGYLVFADDHRAHGNTDKETLGFCKGDIWADTLTDIGLLNQKYRAKYPNVKYVIFGHSYGSFLLQSYLQQADPYVFDGVILSGSAKMQGVQIVAGRVVASLGKPSSPANAIKKMSFDAYDKCFQKGTFISSLEKECQIYKEDSHCGFVCSNNFYKCFFGGLKGIYSQKRLKAIDKDIPILIVSGESDPVGNFGKSTKKLYETYLSCGVKNVTLRLFKGNRHEVLNDVSALEACSLICDFANSVIKRKNGKEQ